MALQMFNYFEDILVKGINEDPLPVSEEQTNQYIDGLQMEINNLKTQLSNIENKLNISSVI